MDPAGNLKQQTATTGSTTVTSAAFNANNQICWTHTAASVNTCSSPPSGATTYSYDANGNQTSPGSAIYNARNQTMSIFSTNFAFLGVDQQELIGDGTNTVTYNALGESSKTTGSTTTYYTRTPDGQPHRPTRRLHAPLLHDRRARIDRRAH